MTDAPTIAKKKGGMRLLKKAKAIPFFVFAILFVMLFFLRNTNLAKEGVIKGLRLAALSVLPSIFPFLVLSDLLVTEGGLPQRASDWLAPLFRLPPAACSAILLGWICGFPVGAVYAAKEFEHGNLTTEETERTAAAASIPSPAFLIGAVGNGLLHDPIAGVYLWTSCVLSAAIICAFYGKKRQKYRKVPQKAERTISVPFFKALTDAVRNAAGISLNLFAFVAFFSVLIEAVKAVFARFGLPSFLGVSVAALLEISNGISSSSALPAPFLLPFCAAVCGWSGFSVHFQIFSVLGKIRLHYGKYLAAKAFQGPVQDPGR